MKQKMMSLALFVLAFLLLASVCYAGGTITLASNPGTYIEETGKGAVAHILHPAWDRSLIGSNGAAWLWSSSKILRREACNGSVKTFREEFSIPGGAKSLKGSISLSADDEYRIELNGKTIASRGGGTFGSTFTHSFTPVNGKNVLRIIVTNYKDVRPRPGGACENYNYAGVIYKSTITYSDPADLWIEDTPPDSGIEPNISGQDMWLSRSIWIRHTNDGVEEHQNPFYGDNNHVYARIRNRGGVASTPGAVVKLYWAYASAGLSWPDNWHEIGSAVLPQIAPDNNQTEIVRIPWNPPGAGHYCLIARIESEDDPLVYTDTRSIGKYVAYNNNIAWRNLNVIGPACEDASLIVRNVPDVNGEYADSIDLLFEGTPSLFSAEGVRVVVNPGLLFLRWQDSGMQGESVQALDDMTVQLLSPQSKILGIPMNADEAESIGFKIHVPYKFSASGPYQLAITQEVNGVSIGGVSYDVTPCLTEEAPTPEPTPTPAPGPSPEPTPIPAVPEPTTMLLFSAGLFGLLGLMKRRAKKK